MIIAAMGLSDGETSQEAALRRWVKYTHDRPYNDRRYAVDDSKLKTLGWSQRTGLAEGLRRTVEWYVRFGEAWWGDISHVLTPFPVLSDEGNLVPDFEHLARDEPPTPVDAYHKKKRRRGVDGDVNGHVGEGDGDGADSDGVADGVAAEDRRGSVGYGQREPGVVHVSHLTMA